MLHQLEEKFLQRFGFNEETIHCFFAPGRVNIIGEHLDYNGGHVLPCALSMGTYLLLRKRNDRLAKFYSSNYNSSFEILLDDIHSKDSNNWWNYPLGVVNEFLKIISPPFGFEMFFSGDLPICAGLSSSASIETVTAFALNELLNTKLPLKEIALLSKRAENDFAGVQCGLMDQYAAAFGMKDQALYLNCVTEDHEYVPVNHGDYEFIIANTNKPRQLEHSAFNDRFDECRQALKTIQRLLPVNHLAEATVKQFNSIEHFFPEEITRKRAHHIIHEEERVKRARIALLSDNVYKLAQLMNESHASLRDGYEASCFELEEIIATARSVEGCIASRPSGAGFGGCIISLIRKDAREKFQETVSAGYKMKTGLTAEFYEMKISDGVQRVIL